LVLNPPWPAGSIHGALNKVRAHPNATSRSPSHSIRVIPHQYGFNKSS
jgi:hypothetical protein